MKRNMIKTADLVKGKIPTMYDMDSFDMAQLLDILHSDSIDREFEALDIAFRYGFALGSRAEKTGKYTIKA